MQKIARCAVCRAHSAALAGEGMRSWTRTKKYWIDEGLVLKEKNKDKVLNIMKMEI